MVIKRLKIEISVLHYLLCWHGAPMIYKKWGFLNLNCLISQTKSALM